jgi:hypothetical protein
MLEVEAMEGLFRSVTMQQWTRRSTMGSVRSGRL